MFKSFSYKTRKRKIKVFVVFDDFGESVMIPEHCSGKARRHHARFDQNIGTAFVLQVIWVHSRAARFADVAYHCRQNSTSLLVW